MTDDNIEDLKEQMQHGSRVEAAAKEQTTDDLTEAITAELKAIDKSGKKTVAIRDESISALLNALEDNPEQLSAALADLSQAVGQDPSSETKSEVLRLAARVGIETAAPDLWEALVDAQATRAAQNV